NGSVTYQLPVLSFHRLFLSRHLPGTVVAVKSTLRRFALYDLSAGFRSGTEILRRRKRLLSENERPIPNELQFLRILRPAVASNRCAPITTQLPILGFRQRQCVADLVQAPLQEVHSRTFG